MVKDLTLNKLKEVLDNNKKVFIDFYADWCGPCRAMGPVVEELSEEVSDVAFYKVNCDDEEELVFLDDATTDDAADFGHGLVGAKAE